MSASCSGHDVAILDNLLGFHQARYSTFQKCPGRCSMLCVPNLFLTERDRRYVKLHWADQASFQKQCKQVNNMMQTWRTAPETLPVGHEAALKDGAKLCRTCEVPEKWPVFEQLYLLDTLHGWLICCSSKNIYTALLPLKPIEFIFVCRQAR